MDENKANTVIKKTMKHKLKKNTGSSSQFNTLMLIIY